MDKFNIEGNDIRVNIPFTKVDKERRIVSGFATLDNVDKHGDRISSDASSKAFKAWIGNLREMHAPKAVGKVVDFQEQDFDAPDGSTYKGMFVSAYVSKGAEDTWQKVIDGTLSGFSIGGRALKKATESDDDGNEYNVIKEYELFELSLVDNPANPLARVISIQKSDDFVTYEGMAVDTKVTNVHYSHDDNVIVLSDEETKPGFENIGWVEDNVNKSDEVKKVVDEYVKSVQDPNAIESKLQEVYNAWHAKRKDDRKEGNYDYMYIAGVYENYVLAQTEDGSYKRIGYTRGDDGIEFGEAEDVEVQVTITEKSFDKSSLDKVGASESSTLKTNEGGADVSNEEKNDIKKSEEVEEKTDEETVEKAADVEEVEEEQEVDADAIAKAVSAQVADTVEGIVKKSEKRVEETKSSFEEAVEALKKSVEEKISGLSDELKTVKEEVDSLQEGTAVKKSLDVGANDDDEDDEENEENFWRGSGFLGSSELVS